MKIKCSKEVDLIEVDTILEVEKYTERKDISKFLKEKLNSNDSIDLKIKKNFIRPLGLIDEENNLTDKGKECIDTDKVWLKEKGEYTLTETKDQFFKYIIDIKPLSISNKKNNSLHSKSIKKQKIISIEDSNKKYNIIKDNVIFYEFRNIPKKIIINYTDDLEGNSYFSIESKDYKIEKTETEVIFEVYPDPIDILNSLEKSGDLKWNKELNAFEVSHSFAEKNNESDYIINKLNFNLKELEIDYLGFQNLILENIDIMPNSLEEAEKWYFEKITNILKDGYITETNFNIKNEDTVNSKYLKYFNTKKLKIDEILNKIKNKDEYWNLKTPLDLALNI